VERAREGAYGGEGGEEKQYPAPGVANHAPSAIGVVEFAAAVPRKSFGGWWMSSNAGVMGINESRSQCVVKTQTKKFAKARNGQGHG
jgi:hypothetical protein